MRLSTKSEYACLALIDLAEHRESGFVKTEDIARRKKIPKKYLEQILLILKRGVSCPDSLFYDYGRERGVRIAGPFFCHRA